MADTNKFFSTGKLPHDVLNRLINKYTSTINDVVIGSRIGMDATVIDWGDRYLVAKTDPITFVTDEIGFYAININANDIACMGAIPRWFLATLLLPEQGTSEKMVERIFQQIATAAREHNIAFCGGHTEVTYGINRPVIIGQMLGEAPKDKLIGLQKAQPDDDILLTKGIAIEATSIIAREYGNDLTDAFSIDFVKQCQNFIHTPGISVLKEAAIATQFDEVHALHDLTEGGLAVGLFELAKASGTGLRVECDMVDIFPESKLLCDIYELDPFGAIASGALLISCAPSVSHDLLSELEKQNISGCKIGKILAPEFGIKMISYEGTEQNLPYFERDEIIKLYE
ncbi:AIR synthase family protein [candidate division KSB1 bacterium]|nr:AIR synthase family protein [candidate division KSB1 bacterium]